MFYLHWLITNQWQIFSSTLKISVDFECLKLITKASPSLLLQNNTEQLFLTAHMDPDEVRFMASVLWCSREGGVRLCYSDVPQYWATISRIEPWISFRFLFSARLSADEESELSASCYLSNIQHGCRPLDGVMWTSLYKVSDHIWPCEFLSGPASSRLQRQLLHNVWIRGSSDRLL